MKPNKFSTFLAAAVMACGALAGCDLFGGEPDTAIVIRGRAVVAETGEPVRDLGVTLRQGGSFGHYPVRALTRTSGDGAFQLSYDPGDIQAPLLLTVNDEPYDGRYTVLRENIQAGTERDLGTIELRLNPQP